MKNRLIFILATFFSVTFCNGQQGWVEVGRRTTIDCVYSDHFGNLYMLSNACNSNGQRVVLKWNSTRWESLGSANSLASNGDIKSITGDNVGNIYIGGNFTNSGGKYYVAKWDGTSWSELGGLNSLAADSTIASVFTDSNGNVYATGYFRNSNNKRYVAKWDGSNWSELGGLNSLQANNIILTSCTDISGNIYVAGGFTNSLGKTYVAKFNGSSWSEVAGTNKLSANGSINTICSDHLGNLYAAGHFTNANGICYVAKWNGSTWSALGGLNQFANANTYIYSICTNATGNIYVGGGFYDANSKYYVETWNGSSWSKLGGNTLNASAYVRSLCMDTAGNIYAGGAFQNQEAMAYVAKWDGSTWSDIGSYFWPRNLTNNFINNIETICTDKGGNLYAGGYCKDSSGNYIVEKWNGSYWITLGHFNGVVISSCTDDCGNLYVSGGFSDSTGTTYIAKWDGSSWSKLGGSNLPLNGTGIDMPHICIDHSGNIFVAGFFDGTMVPYILKWDGISWTPFYAPKYTINPPYGFKGICTDYAGNVYAIGLTYSNNNNYVAKWTPSGVWSDLGGANSLPITSVNSICSDPAGNIYIGVGYLASAPSATCNVMKWDGTTWGILGGANGLNGNQDVILSLCSDNAGNIYAANNFTTLNPWPNGYTYVAKWNGTSWSSVGGSYGIYPTLNNGNVDALCTDYAGNIYASGSKQLFNLIITNTVAEYFQNSAGGCSSYINIHPDTIPHNWIASSYSSGTPPLTYCWNWGDGTTSSGATPSHTYTTPGYYNICVTINDATGCSTSYCDSSHYLSKPTGNNSMITINVVDSSSALSGLPNITEKTNTIIYPNPTTGRVTIENNTNVKSYQLYDIEGKMIMNGVVNAYNFNIDLGTLQKGIYIVALNCYKGVIHKKISKE